MRKARCVQKALKARGVQKVLKTRCVQKDSVRLSLHLPTAPCPGNPSGFLSFSASVLPSSFPLQLEQPCPAFLMQQTPPQYVHRSPSPPPLFARFGGDSAVMLRLVLQAMPTLQRSAGLVHPSTSEAPSEPDRLVQGRAADYYAMSLGAGLAEYSDKGFGHNWTEYQRVHTAGPPGEHYLFSAAVFTRATEYRDDNHRRHDIRPAPYTGSLDTSSGICSIRRILGLFPMSTSCAMPSISFCGPSTLRSVLSSLRRTSSAASYWCFRLAFGFTLLATRRLARPPIRWKRTKRWSMRWSSGI
jgi:hypothetical protein